MAFFHLLKPRRVRICLASMLWLPALVAAAHPIDDSDVARFERSGPYAVTVTRSALCCDSKGNAFDVYRPFGLPEGSTAPLVTWGNGTIAAPDKYDFLLRHLASWGLVVIATRDESVGSGQTMLDAVEQATQRGAALGVRIDPRNVAAVGHSQGAAGAMHALMKAAGTIKTAIAIELPGQQFCRHRECDDIPSGMPVDTSVFFVSGSLDGLSPPLQKHPTSPPLQSVEAYYDAVPAGRTKARGAVIGADHNDIQGNPECRFLAFGCKRGVQGFVGYITAWLTWQLEGDASAGKLFRGDSNPSIFADTRWTAVDSRIR